MQMTVRAAGGGGSSTSTAGMQRAQQRRLSGRAYRAGRLICGRVQVTISDDERIGQTAEERCVVELRFHEPLDDRLRVELTRLLRRRGAAAGRAAERIDPIEVVVDDPSAARLRIVGRIQPPRVHHGALRDIEFPLCRLEPARS
jgi:hypothetical protein